MMAASEGNAAAVDALLEANADLNAKDKVRRGRGGCRV